LREQGGFDLIVERFLAHLNPHASPEPIDHLPLENPCQPTPLRRLATKLLSSRKRGRQGFLHEILGHVHLSDFRKGEAVEILAVGIDPGGWVGSLSN